jgi:hypothetical protein
VTRRNLGIQQAKGQWRTFWNTGDNSYQEGAYIDTYAATRSDGTVGRPDQDHLALGIARHTARPPQ